MFFVLPFLFSINLYSATCGELFYFNHPHIDRAVSVRENGEIVGRMTYKIQDSKTLIVTSEWIRTGRRDVLRDLYSDLLSLHREVKEILYAKTWKPSDIDEEEK